MFRFLINKKAQSTMEYALLIAVVIGVFSAMQIYTRRSLQSRLRGGLDKIPYVTMGTDGASATAIFGDNTQYEPYYVREGAYNFDTTSSEGEEKGVVSQTGGQRDVSGATSQRTGSQTITGAKQDDF